jgi:hypothetical protein
MNAKVYGLATIWVWQILRANQSGSLLLNFLIKKSIDLHIFRKDT